MSVIRDTIGGTAFWRRRGTGATLVCLHGIGSHGDSFLTLLPHLPDDWDVIAWTAPGYDGSADLALEGDRQAAWPSEHAYAARLTALLGSLDTGPVTLLGHSLGALVAARFAADHSARMSRLVLADPATGHGQAAGVLSGAAAKRIADLQAQGPADFAAARAPRLLARPDDRPDALAEVQRQMSRVQPGGYADAVRMLASGRLEDSLRRVTCPAAILWGQGDVITPRDQADRAAAALGGATVHEIPDAGHASYVEAPREFAAALVGALEQTRKEESLT